MMAETSVRTSHLLLQILILRRDTQRASQIAEHTAGDEDTIVRAAAVCGLRTSIVRVPTSMCESAHRYTRFRVRGKRGGVDVTNAGRLSALAAALSRVDGAPTRALSHFDV